MLNSSLNSNTKLIDYDVSNNNENQTDKLAFNTTYCSKITTKAVIETSFCPDQLLNYPQENIDDLDSKKILHSIDAEIKHRRRSKSSSSNSSSNDILKEKIGLSYDVKPWLETCILKSNSDEINCISRKQDLDLYLLDDVDISENSISDSTVTSLTSDFTSVSPFSSNSSSSSDLSSNSSNYETSKDLLNIRPIDKESFNEFDTSNTAGVISPITVMKSECINNQNLEQLTPVLNNNHTGIKLTRNGYEGVQKQQIEVLTSESGKLSKKGFSTGSIEDKLKKLSLSSKSSSSLGSTSSFRDPNKLNIKRRKCNISFNREELIRIERENLILLKKIMAHSKPRNIRSLFNQPAMKKSSATINRAKLQKKIEQDNYILYTKISALGKMKDVC